MQRPRTTVLLRWITAGLVSSGGVLLLARVMTGESDWSAVFGRSLLGLGGLMLGIILVAPEVVRWAISPLSRLLDSILLPSETILPPVDFKLARFYAQSGRYEEACEEYFKVLYYHPDSAEACLEGIRAAALGGDEPTAKKFYRRARRLMRSGDKPRLLEAVYAARHELLFDTAADPAALAEAPAEATQDGQLEDTREVPPEAAETPEQAAAAAQVLPEHLGGATPDSRHVP